MKIIYKNEVYSFIDTDYTSPGFKHFFLLFTNEENNRKAYSVQMAVNYIRELPTATIDQEIDEQTFVACIPMTEYPEVIEYLKNNCKGIDLKRLTDNLANNLIEILIELLNSNNDINDKQLINKTEKLSQYVKLLELNRIEKPQSLFKFDEYYHTYLNKQRVFKYSLKYKLRIRSLIMDIDFILANHKDHANYINELKSKIKELCDIEREIKNFNFSWYEDLEREMNELKRKFSLIITNK